MCRWVRSFLILSLAVLCHAGVYDSRPDSQSEPSYIHNAFFLDASFGFQYLHFLEKKSGAASHYDYNDDRVKMYDEYQRKNYDGEGPEFDLKLGGVIKSRAAVYAHFSFSRILSGEYQYVEKTDGQEDANIELDAKAYRFFFGGGVNVYFVRNPESAFYGLYLGTSLGMMVDYAGKSIVRSSDYMTEFDEQGFSWTFETGKLWPIGDLWHVGIYGRAAFDAPIRFEDPDGPPAYDETQAYYTLSVGVAFTRK